MIFIEIKTVTISLYVVLYKVFHMNDFKVIAIDTTIGSRQEQTAELSNFHTSGQRSTESLIRLPLN